jgi:hypothetical protein
MFGGVEVLVLAVFCQLIHHHLKSDTRMALTKLQGVINLSDAMHTLFSMPLRNFMLRRNILLG